MTAKYLRVEAQLTAAASICLEGLRALGLGAPHLDTVWGWVQQGYIASLRFSPMREEEHALEWTLEAVCNDAKNSKVRLGSRSKITAEVMGAEPLHGSDAPVELPLTWLLQQLESREGSLQVKRVRIDRSLLDCSTPRRNRVVDAALDFFYALNDGVSTLARGVQDLLLLDQAITPASIKQQQLNAKGVALPSSLFVEAAWPALGKDHLQPPPPTTCS